MEKQAQTRSGHNLKVIVKPTVDCNLGCDYCYEGNSPYRQQMMDSTTLKNTITKFANFHSAEKPLEFIWHGGEPLMMGVDFYKNVLELQQKGFPSKQFKNNMQTNGTLLDKSNVEFFIENNIGIGISIDGPPQIHNAHRKFQDGTGSYDKTINAIEILREVKEKYNKPDVNVGVIATFTDTSLNHLDELYDFISNKKLNAKINPIFFEGKGKDIRGKSDVNLIKYKNAMIKLFDRWIGDQHSDIMINPFDEMISNLIYGTPGCCVFMGHCYDKFLTVLPNGDVYPCGQWSLDGFCLGNVNKNSVSEIVSASKIQELKAGRNIANSKCTDCDFFGICNSGCLKQSYMTRNDISDKDYFCSYYKSMFAHIRELINKELQIDNFPVGSEFDPEMIKHQTLKRIIQYRTIMKCSHDYDWQDKQWEQWRGDWNETKWSGDTPFRV